ncbi:hypothetical protein F5Y04DRAFT_148734 [Hypomontagnella monticulosa]|nr:hypothetical protein F5Y04DRAFT_148734 [Hypomontagnella monticulosa]
MSSLQKIDPTLKADVQALDSGIAMSNEDVFGPQMEAATAKLKSPLVTYEFNGLTVDCTIDQLIEMGSELAKARAEECFPKTTASPFDHGATIEDYMRLTTLTDVRGSAPREEWSEMPDVIELTIKIAQDIQTRDKLAAGKSEEQRVKAHVDNMMSGVSAEAKLYNIVKHAVAYSVKNGSGDQAATMAGQNMLDILNGIRGSIKEMAEKGTHGVHDVNVETVLEEVFGMIDFALGGHTRDMDGQLKDFGGRVDGQVKQMGGQINDMRGEIMHLNAIGQHVDAIDNHVHSLGNNLNAMGTLLNSTNGNVVSMTTQVALLQTIVNMLPRMIAEAVQEILPEALENGMNPLMEAIAAQLGVILPGAHQTPKVGNTKKFLSFVKSGFGLFKKSKTPRSIAQFA